MLKPIPATLRSRLSSAALVTLGLGFSVVPGAAQEIELPWVTIPAGTFRMGCVPDDSACLAANARVMM